VAFLGTPGAALKALLFPAPSAEAVARLARGLARAAREKLKESAATRRVRGARLRAAPICGRVAPVVQRMAAADVAPTPRVSGNLSRCSGLELAALRARAGK